MTKLHRTHWRGWRHHLLQALVAGAFAGAFLMVLGFLTFVSNILCALELTSADRAELDIKNIRAHDSKSYHTGAPGAAHAAWTLRPATHLRARLRVAVREAAEALDDVPVPPGVFQRLSRVRVIQGEVLEEEDGQALIRESLAVPEGQVHEPAPHRRQRHVHAPAQHVPGHVPGSHVRGKGVGRAAEEAARELIQEQEQRQGAEGLVGPVLQLAGGGTFVELKEAARALRIKGRVPLEPVRARPSGGGRRRVAEPEMEYLDA